MKSTELSLGGPEFPVIGQDGTVTIADSNLLLTGDYSRDGDDLVLTGTDGQQLQIVEYFSQATPPALISSDGQMLGGETVSILAGPQAPGQYAQTTGGQFGEPIGQVETLSGSASAQRTNGLDVELEVGSQVFQGDVVSAGANSSVGITFLDKTVFTLENSATMVLNELVYDPAGSSNSMLFNLIGGTAAFVAGAVAKSGDMKIETPVAVMAIRGTTPAVLCEGGANGCVFTGAEGQYDLLHKILHEVLATIGDPTIVVTLDSVDGTPVASAPDAATQAAFQKLLNSLSNTVDILNERVGEDGELVPGSGTGSPDFTEQNFIESIAGFFTSTFSTLLAPEVAEAEEEETDESTDPPIMVAAEPVLEGETDEDSSVIIEVITEDDLLNLGELAEVIGVVVTSGLGTATVINDGTAVSYDPGEDYNSLAEGENAAVEISILIDLGDGTTQTQTATITVLGVNDMPDADPDQAATNESAAVSIDVLDNDSDPDTSDVLSITSANITSGLGAVSIVNGMVNYDPAGAYDHLSAGETATVIISYEISDGHGGTASSTVTVVVSGENADPLVTAAEASGMVSELPDGDGGENAQDHSTDGIISFSDTDLGDVHTVSVSPAGGGYLGALTASVTNATFDDGTGEVTWEFTVNDADLDYLAATDTLVQTYTIEIDDGQGGTVSQDVTITIQGTNDAPLITGEPDTSGAVTEITDGDALENNFEHSANGAVNFADVDLADIHTVSVSENGGGFRGTLTAIVSNDSTGDGVGQVSWTFLVDDADLDDLAANQTLTQDYTITVDDGQGGTATQVVTITIHGTNDEPLISSGPGAGSVDEIGDGAAGENSQLHTANGTLDFGDVDLNDGHTVGVDENDEGFLGLLTASVSDASQGDGSGQISWVFSVNDSEIDYLAAGQSLTQVYTITVDDGNGGTADQQVTITINGTNDAPVITGADAAGSVTEFPEMEYEGEGEFGVAEGAHDPVTGTVDFADVDIIDTHTVGVAEDGAGYFGELTAQISDAATGDGTGEVSWAFNIDDSEIDHLGANDVLMQSYTITVDDGNGGTAEQTVTITIYGSNDSPVITSGPGAGSVTELADGAIGENSELLITGGTLDFGDVDLSDSHTVSAQASGEGYRGTFTPTISDPSLGDGAGEISWTFVVNDGDLDDLKDGQMLTQTYTISVDDGQGGIAYQTVTVTINGSNDGPVIIEADDTGAVTEIADQATGENIDDLTDSGSLTISDDDLGDIASVGVTDGGAGYRGIMTAEVSASDPSIIDWTFTVNDSAVDDLAAGQQVVQLYTLTVTDSFGATVEQVVEITITGTNDAPVISSTADTGSVTELDDNDPGEGSQTHSTDGTLDFTDADLADSHTVSVTPVNGAGFVGTLNAMIANPAQGDGAGQILWTYTAGDGELDHLAAGQSLTQVYTVTVTDINGVSDNQTVTITINGANDDPIITGEPGEGSVDELADEAAGEGTLDLTAGGTISFGDVDLTDGHTVGVSENGAGFRGILVASVSDASTGDGNGEISWAFTINDGGIDDLAAGQTLTQVYTITVDDGNGGTDTQTVTIEINGTNDAPIITGAPGIGAVTELTDGDAVENSFNHSANGTIAFGDVDLADGHTVSFVAGAGGYLGSFTPSISDPSQGDGSGQISWVFAVNDADLDTLSATDTLIQTYTITVDDGNGGTDFETVTITIQGTNDDPVITSADTSGSVDELQDGAAGENTAALSATGNITFDDVDANDTHTVGVTTIGSAPRGGLSAQIINGTVVWTYAVIAGELDDLAAGESVIQSYQVTIDDGQGGTDTQIVDITLTGTNDVAIITGVSTGTVIEDDAIDTIVGLLEVTDPDIRQDGTQEAAFNPIIILGIYGTLTMAAGGEWSYTLDNTDPDTDALGFGDSVTDSFTVTTIDGTMQEINVTVEGVGFDFEFANFGGNSGSSELKLLDAGTIESIDIDLLITPMPLTVMNGGNTVANKVNATQSDLGVGGGQDIDETEGLRFEFVTGANMAGQNELAALTYDSHISLSLFQAQVNGVQGSANNTASLLIRIVNANDDDDLTNDGNLLLTAGEVSVTPVDGDMTGIVIEMQADGTVLISGLQAGDIFTIDSGQAFNRVEIENASDELLASGDLAGGNNFELGLLGFNMYEAMMLVGDGGPDPLEGGAGNDTLNSGPGQQYLTGNGGIDTFVFDGNASIGLMADIITDYEQNVDVIDLTDLFELASGAFNEAAVEEFVRYHSPGDTDTDNALDSVVGDLYVDIDGAGGVHGFELVAHLDAPPAPDVLASNVILKVEDGTDVGYVTIV